ncbi:MAG TPA: molybdopterin cofactor-binding domain-containing protein [Pyrinomonadaceae bacterium]|jgi:isoquinoline 1-oxidoreductase|nr:molybdopterin cofactor-binding domain-containing protein [Pyrinomonadaceae bacterium]
MTDAPEVERYELQQDGTYQFDFDRRQFMKVFGGGLALLVPISNLLGQDAERQGESGRGGFSRNLPQEIGAWIHIAEDGSINVYTGKVELGQNIRTSLTQAVAEELQVEPSMIRLVMADTDVTPFDAGTFGSRTTPTMAPQLRKAAVAARETLVALAAQQWQVEPGTVRIVDSRFVNHDKTKSLSFADLAKGLKLVKTIPADVKTTPTKEWTVAGTSLPKVDGREFVTGRHKYTSDLKREGMLFGKVVRPSTLGATLISSDPIQEKDAGSQVVKDGDFIGVATADQQTLTRLAGTVSARWKPTEQPGNAELFNHLRKTANPNQGRGRPVGSVADGFAAADKQLEQTYTVAYIAHVPLEPRAAVAEWVDNKLTVWTGTQRPFGVRGELAEAFHLPEARVRVIVPDTGSGYGGKHTGECAIEAARLALATKKPVKVVWSREEEFTWAYFRPAGVIDVKSGVKNDGTITAWEFHNYNSGTSAIDGKYDIPNQLVQFHPSQSPLRQGSYRGLAATANHFARETHIDELSALLNLDPLQFRLHNLKDERLRAVLEAAATRFGWGWGKRKTVAGRGVGIACGFEKGGYVGTCAEVSVAAGAKVKIERVVESFECGAIVNPKHLENQVEGAVVMAIGGALFEAVEFANGNILNSRLSRYRVPRFSDVPNIEIVLVDRKDLPSAGSGETPIVGLAPAVGNAIFAATGKRLRSLPLAPKGLPS